MHSLTRCALLIVFAAAIAVPVTGRAQTPAAPTEPVVIASGTAVVKAAPDQAWVTLATESRSKNPKDAQNQNANAMTAVQKNLAGAGVPADAIRTLSYDLQLESDWVNGRQVARGYVARNLIEVRLDDITRVGEVIDVAVTSGVNAVHGVRFDLKKRDALERDALRRATTDARQRAEAAAAGAGRAIDRIIRIEEGGRSYPQPMEMAMMRQSAAGDGARPPVMAGEIEIRASVTLTATLK